MNAPATPLPPPVVPRADFPGWMPAMLVKELRQALRARGFVGLFILSHLAAVLIFWWTIEINLASGLRDTFTWLNGVFWGLLNVVLLLVVPLRGLGSLRMEIDNKTLDLLVLTRLTAWRIVLGKWVALVAQAVLFLVAILPYGVVRYFFGAVDLANDLYMAAWLFVVSVTLAAGCLWVSGLPKIFRVVLPIVLFFVFQSFGMASVISSLMTGRGGFGGGARVPYAILGVLGVFVLGVVTAVFLGLAVRRIAPPAENHARAARFLGLFLLLVSLLLGMSGLPGVRDVVMFGVVAIALVSVLELSRDCLPMRSHCQPWQGGGQTRAWLGRLFLPGWPSAMLYAAAALGLLAAAVVAVPSVRPTSASAAAFVWWLVLAWQALLFPALLLSFLPPASTMRIGGTGYFVVQGLFGTISLMSATNSAVYITGENFARTLDAICHLLPVFSFWLGIESAEKGFSAGDVAGQLVALLVLVGLSWRQSRIYWGTVARFARRPDEAAAGSS